MYVNISFHKPYYKLLKISTVLVRSYVMTEHILIQIASGISVIQLIAKTCRILFLKELPLNYVEHGNGKI